MGDELSTQLSPPPPPPPPGRGGGRLPPIPLHASRGLTLVRGEGSYLWDDKDRRYLDLMTNYGVNLLGHTDALVTDAIKLQASQLTNAHQSFETPARQDLVGR